MKNTLSLLLLLLPLQVNAANVRLTLPQPDLIMPLIQAPLESRESKISAQEYPLAHQLKPLLDSQQYTQAQGVLHNHIASAESVTPALHLLNAQLNLELKSYAKADESFQAALKLMPDLVRAHQGLATLYLSTEKPRKAQQHLIKAISLGAANASLFTQLGYLNMQLDSPLSAVAAYQQALMLAPQDSNIKQGLLFALTRSKQFTAANNLLEQMLIDRPNDAEVWLQRANLAIESKDQQTALASMEVAMRLGDKHPSTKQLAAQVHLKLHNYPRALVLLEELIDSAQLDMPAFQKLMTWLIREKKWQYAEPLLANMQESQISNQQSQSSHDKSQLLYFQGMLSLAREQPSAAAQAFEQAIKIDPSNGDSLLAFAKLVADQKQFVQAELLYQRAERIKPLQLPAMLGRAQVYIEQKDFVQALQLLRQTAKTFPKYHGLEGNIRSLSQIVNNQS